ncbi:MAG: S8 family serine peptidase [Planctomycetota bacterium]
MLKTKRSRVIERTILLNLIVLLVTSSTARAVAANDPAPADYAPNEIIIKFSRALADDIKHQLKFNVSAAELTLSRDLDRLNAEYRVRRIKPLFKNFRYRRRRLKALRTNNKTLLTTKQNHILRRLKRAPKGAKVPALERIYKLEVQPEQGQTLEELVEAYNNIPGIEYAELNYIVSVCKVPDDPLYFSQWSLAKIHAPEAWDINTGSSEIIVAVVDTGVDYIHRDIQNNMWINNGEIPDNAIDDDGNGYIDDIFGYDFFNGDGDANDDHGHGTHCAGIIAADTNNALDIAGLSWNSKIMTLKSFGAHGRGRVADAVNALYYAVENGADITSNSWTSGGHSETLEEVTAYAHSQGVITVAAAGNTGCNCPEYPAGYEHVIAVAATDSNDSKPFFSNYGEWVDIAAPGVDVLSLRATGTSMGFPYDSYNTVASGTSMACPHVSGACALILSFYPEISIDKLRDILLETADAIDPETCASGRLNLYEALKVTTHYVTGGVSFDRTTYSCSDTVQPIVRDFGIMANATQDIDITTDGGDSETLTLIETPPSSAFFTGTIQTEAGDAITQDGILQVLDGQIITATYYDANDGTGNPVIVTDTAVADCRPSEVLDVQIEDVASTAVWISFETDEPTTARLRCGRLCGGRYTFTKDSNNLSFQHNISLFHLYPEAQYHFVIDTTDAVGNENTDDNSGICYSFTTAPVLYVPENYQTIQEAINAAGDYDIVLIADGTYTGPGNRDIDFLGKIITVRSENGPDNCIIDCNGTQTQPHRGFYFHSAEDANTVLDGVTIINGYAPNNTGYSYGGGIYCSSSPTIANCVITNNIAEGTGAYGGAIYCGPGSRPAIKNCTIADNSADSAGGIECEQSSPIITNCIFTGNLAAGTYRLSSGGGAVRCSYSKPTLTNCTFTGNSAEHGGAIHCYSCRPTITNCNITDNTARRTGGGLYTGGSGRVTINNCKFIGNLARGGGALYNYYKCRTTLTNCLFLGNTAKGAWYISGGAISSDYGSELTVINSTFCGNRARRYGGAIYSTWCKTMVASSIFWANTTDDVSDTSQIYIFNDFYPEPTEVICSDIQYGYPGLSNINSNPRFVDLGYWDANGIWVEGDYHLRRKSPCINTGAPDYIIEPTEFDLDNRPRAVGRLMYVDMGAYEYNPNYPPVADAGPDKTAYAWCDRIADVMLDGSDSNDPDSNELAYQWSWSVYGNAYDANGVNPVIELPVGEHIIELIVNDGHEHSKPDKAVITVIPPIEARMTFTPQSLNCKSRGKWVKARITLPEGILPQDVALNVPAVAEPMGAESERINLLGWDDGPVELEIVFDRRAFCSAVPDKNNSYLSVTVSGSLTTGQYFSATNIIKLINDRPPRRRP